MDHIHISCCNAVKNDQVFNCPGFFLFVWVFFFYVITNYSSLITTIRSHHMLMSDVFWRWPIRNKLKMWHDVSLMSSSVDLIISEYLRICSILHILKSNIDYNVHSVNMVYSVEQNVPTWHACVLQLSPSPTMKSTNRILLFSLRVFHIDWFHCFEMTLTLVWIRVLYPDCTGVNSWKTKAGFCVFSQSKNICRARSAFCCFISHCSFLFFHFLIILEANYGDVWWINSVSGYSVKQQHRFVYKLHVYKIAF